MRPLLVTPSVVVADWFCPGEVRPWAPDHARYHQIELPIRGAHIRRFGSAQKVVDATRVACDRPGEEFALRSPSARPQQSTLLFWRGELAQEMDGNWCVDRVRPVSCGTARLHFDMLAAGDAVEMEERALGLLHALTACEGAAPRGTAVSPTWRRLAADACHLIATCYDERLTVGAIATACKTSPFHLSRVFRAVYQTTLHRHLTRVRLRAALFELRHGACDLAHVALNTGFSSHSHFARAFRAEFGITPSACRAGTRPAR